MPIEAEGLLVCGNLTTGKKNNSNEIKQLAIFFFHSLFSPRALVRSFTKQLIFQASKGRVQSPLR